MAAFVTSPSPGVSVVTTRILSVAATLVVLAGVIFNILFVGTDPNRCDALLNRGTWLNPVAHSNNGSRFPFTDWQPEGCMLHKYSKDDITDCADGRPFLFIGDSTTRQVFWGLARQVCLGKLSCNGLRDLSHVAIWLENASSVWQLLTPFPARQRKGRQAAGDVRQT